MALPEIKDVDMVYAAIEKAREHALALGKPVQLDRVAVFLGVNRETINEMMNYDGTDEDRQAIVHALKMVKQESLADLHDCLSDKGNVTGYMFQCKTNHGMVEAVDHNVNISPVRFVGLDEIQD